MSLLSCVLCSVCMPRMPHNCHMMIWNLGIWGTLRPFLDQPIWCLPLRNLWQSCWDSSTAVTQRVYGTAFRQSASFVTNRHQWLQVSFVKTTNWSHYQWIGLREHLQEIRCSTIKISRFPAKFPSNQSNGAKLSSSQGGLTFPTSEVRCRSSKDRKEHTRCYCRSVCIIQLMERHFDTEPIQTLCCSFKVVCQPPDAA